MSVSEGCICPTAVNGILTTTSPKCPSTLNVPFSESVINYQNCIDAQNYLWTFNGGGPNISSSSVPNPTVSYSNVSPTSIKLICWSNNGCYDSLQKFGPNIFISPATQDSCWTMVNNAPDPIWQGHFDYDIAQLSPSKTGFLASGSYFKASFASRYGDSLRLSSYGGAYIGKYDFNGVLKWMNYTKQTDYNSYPGWSTRDVISSVKEDLAGNIYICGRASSYFYDNKGDSAMLQDHSTFFSSTYFIAKLDSSGKFLWRLTGYGLCPKKLITDNSNNIIVSSLLEHSSIQMELNGLASYTITNMSLNNTSLMKLSPFGNILWETKLNISATNFSGITGIGVDKNNNLLVTGVYEYNTGALYSPSSSSLTLLGPNFSTQGGKFFLLKYDTLGNVLWKVRALTEGTINGLSAVSASMGLDNEGNIYLTGTNENGVLANEKFVVYNADGSSDSTHEGQYFVLKINKNGFLKWINSTQNISSWEGLVIDVKGNEISTIGMSSYYLNYQPTAIFTSQNGINTTLTMGTDDYFIAIYDTLGNLNKIVTNGANSYNPPLIDRYAIYMHRDQQGAYYVGECMRFFIGASNYTTFNTTIASTNGWDGAITKFSSLNCGLVTYPNTVTGLSDKHLQSSILVYPNPSKNLVFINDSNPNLLVKLLSITGQDVPVRYINGTISIENLSSGMYFLLIYKDNKLYHQEKIIKE